MKAMPLIMKTRRLSRWLVPLAVLLTGCSKFGPSTRRGEGFEQTEVRATPLRITYAQRTELFVQTASGEISPKSPENDVLLILVLRGLAAKELDAMASNTDARTMNVEGGGVTRRLQAWGRTMTISSDAKMGDEAIMLLASVPRAAAEFKVVMGDKPPAVLHLSGPVKRVIRDTEVK